MSIGLGATTSKSKMSSSLKKSVFENLEAIKKSEKYQVFGEKQQFQVIMQVYSESLKMCNI